MNSNTPRTTYTTTIAKSVINQLINITTNPDRVMTGRGKKPSGDGNHGNNKHHGHKNQGPSPHGNKNQGNSNQGYANQGYPQQQSDNASPEYTRITAELADWLQKEPKYIAVPIYWKEGRNDGNCFRWSDPGYVKLPHDSNNSVRGQQGTTWHIITSELQRLQSACSGRGLSASISSVMSSVVGKYFPGANKISNFKMLSRKDLEQDVIRTIPIIVDFALKLPSLVGTPIPNLKCGDNKTIFMSRKLCCSLLANAFFCTFPEASGHVKGGMPDYNFIRLFNDTNSNRCNVKKEKIKCLLNYFNEFRNMDGKSQHQIVSYERRCVRERVDWAQSKSTLCDVLTDVKGNIEDTSGMLQCDFANKVIGGGVLNDGSVMEEIRFCISPELIVSRLFTETMDDNEVVVITGSLVYSEYSGYSTSFKFTGPKRNFMSNTTDKFGRTHTQLVAIDALSFKKHDAHKQYDESNIKRELHKCYVAFMAKGYIAPVATGNWGCGAFNGNPEIKFLIQWMAVSQRDRPKMQYHTSGDSKQAKDIDEMVNYLKVKKIEVSKLYKLILKFSQESSKGSIFNYVRDNAGSGGGISGFINKVGDLLS